jgi:hypothetical protein
MALYISSSDYTYFAKPNEILSYNLEMISHKQLLKIELRDPVLSDGLFSIKGNNHYEFYLLARYNKLDLIKLNKFPIAVYVLYFPTDGKKEIENFQNIAWANIYDNFEDALDYEPPYSNSIFNKLSRIFFDK